VSLLVVPIAPDDAGLLTLDEWAALCSRERVYFERPDHPLRAQLQARGVSAGPFDDEPSATDGSAALVTDPESPRVIELARAGALVMVGPARLPDSLTAAYGAPAVRRAMSSLGTLALVMARLRSPDGCPWDREQTHRSLEVHLLEEAHEVIDAIERGDSGTELQEELGDVLLQVFFHARIAEVEARFDVADVADAIVAKLIHRHPHVFGETTVSGAAEVVRNWEAIKRAEKGRADAFDDLPKGLPALLSAYKTQKRAAGLGFEAPAGEAADRLRAATEEGDIGSALFWLVALARARGEDPETALLRATADFRAGLEQ
jgi:XTP/dITP diphosphohydrolase